MTTDEQYEDPDSDIARKPILLSQALSLVAFALIAGVAFLLGHPSRTFWLALMLAFLYWTERKFFVLRIWELNERLRRMEHKLNVIVRRYAKEP